MSIMFAVKPSRSPYSLAMICVSRMVLPWSTYLLGEPGFVASARVVFPLNLFEEICYNALMLEDILFLALCNKYTMGHEFGRVNSALVTGLVGLVENGQ